MYVLYFYVVGCVCQPQINEHVMLCYVIIIIIIIYYYANGSTHKIHIKYT